MHACMSLNIASGSSLGSCLGCINGSGHTDSCLELDFHTSNNVAQVCFALGSMDLGLDLGVDHHKGIIVSHVVDLGVDHDSHLWSMMRTTRISCGTKPIGNRAREWPAYKTGSWLANCW